MALISRLSKQNPELDLKYIQVKHYDRQDGVLSASMEDSRVFAGNGSITARQRDSKVISDLLAGKRTYAQSVLFVIGRLHFATFGGLALKTMFFLMAIFTCLVIISGVLFWKEARNKKNYTERQKRFHHRVTMCYLAICFALFPAVAVLFSAELWVPNVENHVFLVRSVFFVSWLVLGIAGVLLKTESRQTRFYLVTGGILSLAVPVTNGIVTGDWIFKTWASGNYHVALTDFLWLLAGVLSLAITLVTKPQKAIKKSKRPETVSVG